MSSGAGLRKRWLNSTILGIGLASFCSDVGHEMATTAMPALLATLGASSALLGLIEGLADGLSSFAKLASGLYSDRLRRRKPLAVAGYFVTASGMAVTFIGLLRSNFLNRQHTGLNGRDHARDSLHTDLPVHSSTFMDVVRGNAQRRRRTHSCFSNSQPRRSAMRYRLRWFHSS